MEPQTSVWGLGNASNESRGTTAGAKAGRQTSPTDRGSTPSSRRRLKTIPASTSDHNTTIRLFAKQIAKTFEQIERRQHTASRLRTLDVQHTMNGKLSVRFTDLNLQTTKPFQKRSHMVIR